MWNQLTRPLTTLTLAGALVLVGCDDSPVDPPVDPQPTTVEVAADTATLTFIGAETTLSATVLDENGNPLPNAAVIWGSSNAGIVAVSSEGVASAVSSGTATITASSGSASGTVDLTVAQSADSIALDRDELLLIEIGATEQLEVTLTDAGGTAVGDAEVDWSSSNEAVATVSQDGLVTAVGSGDAVVTAESGDFSATAEVRVQPATSVLMDPLSLDFQSIGDTASVSAMLRDADGEEIPGIALTWSSSDEDVITVDSAGRVEAVGTGSATLSAGFGSIQGTTTVTVTQTASGIEVSPTEVTLVTAGATAELSATVTDAGGTGIDGAEVTWTSSNPAVATVDAEGEVTAVANGTAVITGQSGEASATSTVTVAIEG